MKKEEEVRKSLDWIHATMKEEIKQNGKTDVWSRGFEFALRIVLED